MQRPCSSSSACGGCAQGCSEDSAEPPHPSAGPPPPPCNPLFRAERCSRRRGAGTHATLALSLLVAKPSASLSTEEAQPAAASQKMAQMASSTKAMIPRAWGGCGRRAERVGCGARGKHMRAPRRRDWQGRVCWLVAASMCKDSACVPKTWGRGLHAANSLGCAESVSGKRASSRTHRANADGVRNHEEQREDEAGDAGEHDELDARDFVDVHDGGERDDGKDHLHAPSEGGDTGCGWPALACS